MKVNLLIDVNALLYSVFFAALKEQEDILLAWANKTFMDTINKASKDYKSDEVILAFDGKFNWRKKYTASKYALTYKKYKGHRRDRLTEAEKRKLEVFDGHVAEFREMLKEHTGLLVLHHDKLEADDLIAGYVQMHQDEAHVILSPDGDYLQLQKYKNVTQIDPRRGKKMDLSEYDNNPDYFIFRKCIRGDASDNVISAKPNIRETRIKKAFNDDFEYNNLMNETFSVEYICDTTGEVKSVTYKTGDVFAENELLMNLSCQPDHIREIINSTITEAIENRGNYNMVSFLKFCKKMDFRHIIDNISAYNKLLKGPSKMSLLFS